MAEPSGTLDLGLGEPVDPVHAEAVRAAEEINEMFQEVREKVARWEPRPCPS
jgi:hypothetical protein